MIKLMKIISGGQSGADRGGLIAGKTLGLETGGTAPPKFMTESGPKTAVLQAFGLTEGEPDPKIYPKRTRKNVHDSDGTLWVGNEESPGGRLTISTVTAAGKFLLANPTPIELSKWLFDHEIETLNVAGNREQKNPGIEYRTTTLILKAIQNIELPSPVKWGFIIKAKESPAFEIVYPRNKKDFQLDERKGYIVGGHIEIVNMRSHSKFMGPSLYEYCMIIDEDGKRKESSFNFLATVLFDPEGRSGDAIVGDVLICPRHCID